MCKSTGPQAACFLEHSNFVNAGRSSSDISRHGCIEMLPIEQRTPCLDQALDAFASQNAGYGTHHSSNNHRHVHHGHRSGDQQKSTTCCLDDMCNYVKTNVRDEVDVVTRNEQKVVQVTNQWNTIRGSAKADNIDSLGKHFEDSYKGTVEYKKIFYINKTNFFVF